MTKKTKAQYDECVVMNASNDPTLPNALRCLMCGGVERFKVPIAISEWSALLKRFERGHRISCYPKNVEGKQELTRRRWDDDRRWYGTSANSLEDNARAGAPLTAPQDPSDLAACCRRYLLASPALQERMAPVLQGWRDRESPDDGVDQLMIAEGIACMLLFPWKLALTAERR